MSAIKKKGSTPIRNTLVGLIIMVPVIIGILAMINSCTSSSIASEQNVIESWAKEINNLNTIERSTEIISPRNIGKKYALLIYPERDDSGRVIDSSLRSTHQACRQISCVCIQDVTTGRIRICESIKYPQIEVLGHPYSTQYSFVGIDFPTRGDFGMVTTTEGEVYSFIPTSHIRPQRLFITLSERQKITISCNQVGEACPVAQPEPVVVRRV